MPRTLRWWEHEDDPYPVDFPVLSEKVRKFLWWKVGVPLVLAFLGLVEYVFDFLFWLIHINHSK